MVLDEVEGLLQHFDADTLARPRDTLLSLGNALRKTTGRILAMDALWGAPANDFFRELDIPHQLLLNEHRAPEARRTFTFTPRHDAWRDAMAGELESGNNIVLVSMSTDVIDRTARWLLDAGLVTEDQVVIHTSKTDDARKRALIDVNVLWGHARVVAYSPTIEAGVDFTGDRFHRIFAYACLGSTTAHGFFQMLGRVRRPRSPDVLVCAHAGVLLTPTRQRKITVAEQRDFLDWGESKLNADHLAPVVCEGQAEHMLPSPQLFYSVLAHCQARKLNSQRRFFAEFQDLARGEGHAVLVDPAHFQLSGEHVDVPEGVTQRAHMLVSLPDLTGPEFHAIHTRVCENRASDDDKWAHYRHLYKVGWGIDRISAAFVNANGTSPANHAVQLCLRMVVPAARQHDFEEGAHSLQMLRLALVQPVLTALGWAHPFDLGNPIHVADAHPALMRTDMFRDYAQAVRAFNARARVPKDWTEVKVLTKSLQIILGAAGILLRSTGAQSRSDGRSYSYSIDAQHAARMAALVNLRRRRFLAPPLPAARAYLDTIGYGPWAELVDPAPAVPSATAPDSACDDPIQDADVPPGTAASTTEDASAETVPEPRAAWAP